MSDHCGACDARYHDDEQSRCLACGRRRDRRRVPGDPTGEEMRGHLRAIARELEADAFDIEAAVYWFASDQHGGQASNLYAALSASAFRPGRCHAGVHDAGDVAAMLYEELLQEFGA